MKVVFYPHKGENRGKEGEKWKSGLNWGADFMLENIMKNAKEYEIIPSYDLKWDNIRDADVVWFHNIATSSYYNMPIIKISPIVKWMKRKNRPVFIGGVRGQVGFERSKKILPYFDSIHTGSVELLNKTKQFNENSYTLLPGVDTDLFRPMNIDKKEFTIGWVGDKNKRMKNYEIIELLNYPYKIASKENYIPHKHMPLFYNKLSAYTHFSSHEGGNRTVLEACACGLPVISTSTGATKQYIDDEWVIPFKQDYDYLSIEFKKRLRKLENDQNLTKKVSKNNRQKSLQYDWKIITKQWIKIIDETYQRVKG
jgi:hypothetical protein